jgi:hypothetical protein
MITVSDSLYTRSLAAARWHHNTGIPLREFFANIPALWNGAVPRRYSIFLYDR